MVPAGCSVGFIGRGFTRHQRVTAELRSRTIVLGHFRANREGRVTGSVTIPRRERPGWHTFRLTARSPFRSVSTRIRVVRHGSCRHDRHHHRWHDGRGHHHYDRLAATGSERTLAVGGAAAGLIAVGGGTMLAVRRRRNA
ncbi:LPXTG cell wall anchor domain-containing protein [Streptomyces nodosus]|uniref:Uncharacterized protein n=1 Tax=Streptomyces nodosus TaxID=40318 RepID=A0A0B5DDX3_9ACTN|nr:LPXTG cell wall anchor domain-containing protein [Streptomyces nodosus]AJE39365.1 hypothetical protein SNOD_04460 [Streptomyces nodosus]MBB4790280.1 hypothetical protein [Streptomyces nodosus]